LLYTLVELNINTIVVSDIAIFVLKRDVKLQLTNSCAILNFFYKLQSRLFGYLLNLFMKRTKIEAYLNFKFDLRVSHLVSGHRYSNSD